MADLINYSGLYESSKKPENEKDRLRTTPANTSDKPLFVNITNANDLDSNIEYDLADGNVSAIKAVYKTINGISHGDKDTSYETSTIIGISITGNTSGNSIKYKVDGRLEDSFFNFPINSPLYLGNNGSITNVVPTTGQRVRLGTSLGIGAIQIEIEEPIIL